MTWYIVKMRCFVCFEIIISPVRFLAWQGGLWQAATEIIVLPVICVTMTLMWCHCNGLYKIRSFIISTQLNTFLTHVFRVCSNVLKHSESCLQKVFKASLCPLFLEYIIYSICSPLYKALYIIIYKMCPTPRYSYESWFLDSDWRTEAQYNGHEGDMFCAVHC